MIICEASERTHWPPAELAFGASGRNSIELLMINRRFSNWKPELDGFGGNLGRHGTRTRSLNKDSNVRRSYSLRARTARNGNRPPLALARGRRSAEGNR